MPPFLDKPHERVSEDAEEQYFDAAEAMPEPVAAALQSAPTGIHFNDLLNEGAVFDTDHVPTRQELEMREDAEDAEDETPADGVARAAGDGSGGGAGGEDGQRWWTKDELAEHLSQAQSVRPNTGIADDEERSAFEVRKSLMQVIFSDPDSGEPLVWKQTQFPGLGPPVTRNSSVEYEIEAYAEHNDEPFDSSKMAGRTYHSRLSSDPVLPGLFVALTSMSVGEKSQFILSYKAAFGKMGCPPRIPPETDIFYDVEVRKVLEEGTIADFIHKTVEEQAVLPFDQLLGMADSERRSGNAYFTDGRKKQAGVRYKRAIRILEDRALKSDDEEKKVNEILLKLYCNTANTSLHLNRPYVAMHYCNKALQLDKDNVKALFHYGKAKIDVGDYDQAIRYLMRARSIKPNNTDISHELARVNRRVTEDRLSSRQLENRMAQMFVSGAGSSGGDAPAPAAANDSEQDR